MKTAFHRILTLSALAFANTEGWLPAVHAQDTGPARSAQSPTAESHRSLSLKTETFDRDPGWDNSANRAEASDPPTVTQDFGWSAGMLGGTVWRTMTPAWAGLPLERPLSFKDAFSASGKISVPPESRNGVAYLGFFNHERQGWRPWSSMAMRIKGADKKILIYTDYMTSLWNAGAAEMELAIPADGSEHTWRLTYDPEATRAPWTDAPLHGWLTNERQTFEEVLAKARAVEPELTPAALEQRLQAALKQGQVTFLARHGKKNWQLKQDKIELRGAVTVQVDGGEEFRSYLSAAMREQPVAMDRFGIFNMQIANPAPVSFRISDLAINGRKIDLATDAGWEGRGNRVQYVEREFTRQNFGYSGTAHAGGNKGEIGGVFYNVEPTYPLHGYYADDVGQLTLEDPIHFAGKITFIEGATDAGMFFGFFRAEDEKQKLPPNSPVLTPGWPQANVLGVVVDGPANIGWWFMPVCTASERRLSSDTTGHVFLPTRQPRTFAFDYDPQANKGIGRATVKLDGEPPFTLDLKPEQRKTGATFDRFGLMSFRRGGKFSVLYFDDLTYTTRQPGPSPRHEQKITTVRFPR